MSSVKIRTQNNERINRRKVEVKIERKGQIARMERKCRDKEGNKKRGKEK
jgi:hypothetical protein